MFRPDACGCVDAACVDSLRHTPDESGDTGAGNGQAVVFYATAVDSRVVDHGKWGRFSFCFFATVLYGRVDKLDRHNTFDSLFGVAQKVSPGHTPGT